MVSEDILERARAALVKPLVWESDERWPSSIFAGPSWLVYEIADEGDGDWTVVFPGWTCGVYASQEAAQAAAQADYVARVLSALDLSKVDAMQATFTTADLAKAWEMGRDAGAVEAQGEGWPDMKRTGPSERQEGWWDCGDAIADAIRSLPPPADLDAKVKESRR